MATTPSRRRAADAINLMYGPGSSGISITVTPTFQYGGFFFRGDLSWVHASDITPGYTLGPTGVDANQPRCSRNRVHLWQQRR